MPVTINVLMRGFDCPRCHVQAALAHRLNEPEQRGKHATLDPDREKELPDWLGQNGNKRHHSRKQESWIIEPLNSKENIAEDV
jgi:hypothetical protein